ncbi:MAG: hypothetical protein IJC88_03985 [Oscillospiraceae bacterium]|nr:hypothetical protein [Oscillospiraceae bacterium]
MTFFYSALLGAILGVLYDTVRLIRTLFARKKAVGMCLDAVFVSVSCLMLLGFVLTVSNGQMRFYVLLGIGLGWMLYAYLLSPTVYSVLSVCVRVLTRVLQFVGGLIHRAFGGIYHMMQFVCRRLLDGHRKKKTQRLEPPSDQA